jgi:hypothetical protein
MYMLCMLGVKARLHCYPIGVRDDVPNASTHLPFPSLIDLSQDF